MNEDPEVKNKELQEYLCKIQNDFLTAMQAAITLDYKSRVETVEKLIEKI
jgi:hypothetical protein